MHEQQALTLTTADITNYENDGVIVLRGVFCDWVEAQARGIEINQAAPSKDARPQLCGW